MAGEFDLIETIRGRALARADVLLGIGDDAALLAAPAGMQLACCADTLNAGVHFPADADAAAIGWKSLAVNLSDLAAMAARPAWCTLSLSLPEASADWLEGFLDGFLALAARHEVALVGGDTTRGPLSISVTAIGFVEPGRALRRDGGRVGDEVWVSGTPGDAAAALALWQAGHPVPDALRQRLDRPEPRVELGLALAGIAAAGIDVSDGLLADLEHVAFASGLGIEVDAGSLPVSAALAALDVPAGQRREWQASGGDDYELCFSAAPADAPRVEAAARGAGVAVTRIGRMVAGAGVRAMVEGREWRPGQSGYRHFG